MRRRCTEPPKMKLPKQQMIPLSSRISDLLSKRKQLLANKQELEKKIYKLEGEYLEIGQDQPITTTLDAYLGLRGEKKKYTVTAQDRIFSPLLPRVYRDDRI